MIFPVVWLRQLIPGSFYHWFLACCHGVWAFSVTRSELGSQVSSPWVMMMMVMIVMMMMMVVMMMMMMMTMMMMMMMMDAHIDSYILAGNFNCWASNRCGEDACNSMVFTSLWGRSSNAWMPALLQSKGSEARAFNVFNCRLQNFVWSRQCWISLLHHCLFAVGLMFRPLKAGGQNQDLVSEMLTHRARIHCGMSLNWSLSCVT